MASKDKLNLNINVCSCLKDSPVFLFIYLIENHHRGTLYNYILAVHLLV